MLTHEQVQAAISAQLDGEVPQLSPDVIDAHVSGCAECAAFRDKAAALSRSLSQVEPAGAPPRDLSEVILAGVEPEWQRASSARQASLTLARVSLGALSAVLLVWAVVVVVSASGLTTTGTEGTLAEGADPERARLLMETAALRFGLASGLGFAAWRPASAPGLLPVACTMFAFLCGFTMRDFALGTVGAGQIYILVATGLAAAGLGWAWAADRGFVLRDVYRTLTASPR
ncbi:zf-HC2 domain-containing protein [Corynebacterium sp. MSK218]|uniref:zf-HC2 domain-containing protein n=1 Tax=Corynebacterium sp. MSK218 TaxID=3050218 RepID=UPI00255142B4|nr:zf-HC2 domain-containing protein [Corynebacterium sp. MSK218]MDK8764612.1 zf-HC2 domain-containing protein [Corynebacterium sp. MSK218]